MNPLALIPLRLWCYGALLVALTIGAWRIEQHGYQRAADECAIATKKANEKAQEQRDKQAATARTAAEGYEKQATVNESKLKAARHDLYVATQNLAGCRLDARAVRLLNSAGDYDTAKP